MKIRQRVLRMLSGAIGVAMLAVGAQPVQANHPAATWYPVRWQAPDVSQVQMCWAANAFNDGEDPGENGRKRIKDGHSVWNQEPGPLTYTAGCFDTSLSWNSHCDNPVNKNGIFWRALGGGALGQVKTCMYTLNPTRLSSYVMAFERRVEKVDWYLGIGSVPQGKMDLWGVATHEAGHAGGFFPHWDEYGSTNLCQGHAGDHTMCKTVQLRGGYLRTLENHDVDTFADAY